MSTNVLTIGVGTLDLLVPCSAAELLAPIELGAVDQSIMGTEINSVIGQRIRARVTTVEVDTVTANLIKATFALRAQVLCQGEVFDNALSTIKCSAVVTGRIQQGLTTWILDIELTECPDPLSLGLVTSNVRLSQVNSGSGWKIAYPALGIVFPGDSFSGYSIFNGVPADTTGGAPGGCHNLMTAVDMVFKTPPLKPNVIVGRPYSDPLGGGSMNPGVWCAGGSRMQMFVERGGVDVYTSTFSPYIGSSLGGGGLFMQVASALVWSIQLNDIIRVEWSSHMQLKYGATDDGARQTVSWGGFIPVYLHLNTYSPISA